MKLLIAALLFGTLPLIVASVILPAHVTSTLTRLGEKNLTEMARELSTLAQNNIQQHVETVRSLARVESVVDALHRHNVGALDQSSLAATNRQLSSMIAGLAANHYQGIFICGADGFIFAGVLKSGESAPYVHLDLRDRAYFDAVRRTLQPVVSDPLRSKISAVPIIVIAIPIVDSAGHFAGMLGLSIKIEYLASLIQQQKIGTTGYPFAIDRHGIIFSHPDPERVFSLDLGRVPGAAELAKRMLNGETGVQSYVSSKGEHKIAAYAPVPVSGWSIAASIETAEFVAPAERIRQIIFALIGGCVIVAVAVGVTFSFGIEELNRTLAVARSSEARFKLFANIATETIWDWDLASDEVWWNEGLTTLFGYSPGAPEKMSAALGDRIPIAERGQITRGILDCAEQDHWSGEHHFQRHDGSLAYVLHRAVAVRNAEGKTVRVIGGMTDITARRIAEEKITEQAMLLNQTQDGIIVRDLNHVIVFWNRGAERIYGWTAAEADGRRFDTLLQIDQVKFEQACRHVKRNGSWHGHLQKTVRSGKSVTMDCRWTLLHDKQGQPKSILTIDTDITEKNLMEAKFLRAQRLESVGTLAGGIAHDLNNLLSPILMSADMLQLSETDHEKKKYIHYIEQSANRATALVKQVLSFARGIVGVRVPVHITYVVREIEAIARSTFPKNITLRVSIPSEIKSVTADPTQLHQVFLNLLVNARDAMPAGGQITITAKNIQIDEQFIRTNPEIIQGPYVLVEVSDTGTGMSPEVLEKLFEPFFTTKEPGKGTGLGLSTVIGITRSHGGTVNVYSEIGQGSTFKVYLPASNGTAESTPATPSQNHASGRGELILLVDDEPVIVGATKQTLEASGYSVITAADGAQALALYQANRGKIALVLSDMMMPVMDGWALINALRRIEPEVVFVGSSGLNDHNSRTKAADAKMKHFLGKPYTSSALLTAIDGALVDYRSNATLRES